MEDLSMSPANLGKVRCFPSAFHWDPDNVPDVVAKVGELTVNITLWEQNFVTTLLTRVFYHVALSPSLKEEVVSNWACDGRSSRVKKLKSVLMAIVIAVILSSSSGSAQ